ncbi:MAG TPA: hypothetical protein PK313_06190 [Myxococcota bacterium]|nr:hypothetical protein [Myxococcota bacterium]
MKRIRDTFLLLSIAATLAACSGGGGADSGGPDAWQDIGTDVAADPGVPGDLPFDPGRDGPPDSGPGDDGPGDPGEGDATDPGPSDAADATDVAPWQFDRDAYEPIRGWILLDDDPAKVLEALDAAPAYGVNHVQLSHDLVMNFEDLLGDDAATTTRVQTLNDAIAAAHQRGMKAFIWVHEFSGTGLDVCYGPEGEVWTQRAAAWNAALDRIPDVDGVVLMFGSAPMSPWFTACTCDWCADRWENPFEAPPNDQRIRLITEALGQVLAVRGQQMVARVFLHEPSEIPWHADGFAAARGVDFVGMHKSDVGDWQPYNPHDPTVGNVGPHPSVLELDVGGEYYGASRLPFCSPGYFRYRMQHAWANRGIGYVVRIERGSNRSLGTPNEINLRALSAFVADPDTPPRAVWDAFLADRYGAAPGSPASAMLRGILEDTFAIRLKSHYALGIWALEKGTDIPSKAEFGELFNRGDMPKWDPAWQAVYDRVRTPDRATVLDLWQEGSEAVDLAATDLALYEVWVDNFPESLAAADREDLRLRLRHQAYAARTWRAIDLFLWAQRARTLAGATPDPDLVTWAAWARDELAGVRQQMIDAGLAGVSPAGPSRIQSFLDATASSIPEGTSPAAPPPAAIAPLRTMPMADGTVAVDLTLAADASAVRLRWGKQLPEPEHAVDLGPITANVPVRVYLGATTASFDEGVALPGLEPSARYVVRAIATTTGDATEARTWMGGEWWVFTPPPCDCAQGVACVEGVCQPPPGRAAP